MSPQEELYSDGKFCREEICRIREAIGRRDATADTYRAAYDSLGLMICYCPPDIRSLVDAQLMETQRRETYAIFSPAYCAKQAQTVLGGMA